jgi:hypothetical protein
MRRGRCVAAWSAQLGAEAIDLLPVAAVRGHRELWIRADGYPNAAAHHLFAGALSDRGVAAHRLRP